MILRGGPIYRIPKPSPVRVSVPVSTAGASKAASTRYLGPVLRSNPRRRVMLPQPYLFDGLTSNPGEVLNQSKPASGFVYPWQPNPRKPGGGVPQGTPWTKHGTAVTAGSPDDYLSAPVINLPEGPTPTGGGGGGSGGGGGGGGSTGGFGGTGQKSGIGGAGGHGYSTL